jgi:hypothetical protein
MKIEESKKEEFTNLVLIGYTIPQLMYYYNCSRNTVATAKKKWGLVGKTPNSRKIDSINNTKICGSCGLEKDLENFFSNGKTPKGTQKYKPTCKVCETSSRKTTFQNKLYSLLNSIDIEYKCMDCGLTGEYGLLDFHHRDPNDKLFNIGDSTGTTYSENAFKEKYLDEILKCDILCPTCHRKRHLLRGRSGFDSAR